MAHRPQPGSLQPPSAFGGAAPPRRAPPPAGARGAPPGRAPGPAPSGPPQAGPTHQLYVKIVGQGESDAKSKALTLQVLQYVHANLAAIRRLGVVVRVRRLTSRELANGRLVEAMRARGILRLPALLTPGSPSPYIGFAEIRGLYEANFREAAAFERRGERQAEGAAPEDDLAQYYAGEMTMERAKADEADGAGASSAERMMDDFRRHTERRQRYAERRGGGPEPPPPGAEGRGAAPAAAPRPGARAGPRPDNVGPPPARAAPAPERGRREVDPEDAEIEATIARLSRDIDPETRTRAFESGGGDSLEDDGGADPQDDLMERAFWGNRTSTDAV